MKIFFTYLSIAILFSLVVTAVRPVTSYVQKSDMLASVFFKNSIESKDVKKKYRKRDGIKVMIVPGHDNASSGAVFNGIKEADMNLRVGEYLYKYLESNKRIDVAMSRNRKGYDTKLSDYLEENSDEIIQFHNNKKTIMRNLISEGKINSYINVQHNSASSRVANLLYGINKYSNDNEFDIVIHIHFNDYPGRTGQDGKYNGFSIYTPEKQYSNSEATKDLAESIAGSLTNLFPKSNMPRESAVVEDQELIAIGAYNTADSMALLIEYGYIYERQFQDPEIKDIIFNELAYQTYLGILDFFGEKIVRRNLDFSKSHVFNTDLELGDNGKNVLALQAILKEDGIYPAYSNLSNCPINGYFGGCTEKSVRVLQEKKGIEPTGYVGDLTKELLK